MRNKAGAEKQGRRYYGNGVKQNGEWEQGEQELKIAKVHFQVKKIPTPY